MDKTRTCVRTVSPGVRQIDSIRVSLLKPKDGRRDRLSPSQSLNKKGGTLGREQTLVRNSSRSRSREPSVGNSYPKSRQGQSQQVQQVQQSAVQARKGKTVKDVRLQNTRTSTRVSSREFKKKESSSSVDKSSRQPSMEKSSGFSIQTSKGTIQASKGRGRVSGYVEVSSFGDTANTSTISHH
jgi:hypothetical protein